MKPHLIPMLLESFFGGILNIGIGIFALFLVGYLISFISKITGTTAVRKGKIISTPNDFDDFNKRVVDKTKTVVKKITSTKDSE